MQPQPSGEYLISYDLSSQQNNLRLFSQGMDHSWVKVLVYTGSPLTGTLTNSEDPDEMQKFEIFHSDLNCLLRLKSA